MTQLTALYSCHLPTSPGQAPKILKIQVKVLDTRELFKNRVDVLVTPVAGEGQAWISEKSLEFEVPPNEVLGLGGEEHEYAPQTEDAYVPLDYPHYNPLTERPRTEVAYSDSRTSEMPEIVTHEVQKSQDTLGGTPICPECGAPIRWDTSPGAVPAWVHVVSSECSGTKGLAP